MNFLWWGVLIGIFVVLVVGIWWLMKIMPRNPTETSLEPPPWPVYPPGGHSPG